MTMSEKTPAPVGAGLALNLDAIEARQKAAASARWEIIGDRDGPRALMALLGEDVPALVAEVEAKRDEFADLLARALPAIAALARVEAVHVQCGPAVCNASTEPKVCHECGVSWPCDTIAALAVTTGEGE